MHYRVRQFFHGLFATITSDEEEGVQSLLSPAEYALFCRMPTDARRHSLNVYQSLLQRGEDDPDLAVAALLHDVGKVAADEAGARLGLWMRVPLVLIEAVRPELISHLSSADAVDGWRYTLFVHLEHPQIGAAWAEEAGSTPTACWLIAAHQDKEPALDNGPYLHNHPELPNNVAALLAALQWADSQN